MSSNIPSLSNNLVPDGNEVINSIAISPDSKLLYLGNSPLNVVDAESLQLKGLGPRGNILAISLDCTRAASHDRKTGKLAIQNLKNESEEIAFDVGPIKGAEFSPNNRWVATWQVHDNTNNLMRLWDTRTGKLIWMGPPRTFHVAFSPRHDQVAICVNGFAVRIVDLHGYRLIDSDPQPLNSRHIPYAVAYSPDGALLAVGFTSGNIVLWNVDPQTGQIAQRCHLRGHTNVIRAIAFSPDNKQLASISNDHSLRIWEVALGQETMTFDINAKLLAFSPNGNRLAIVGADNKVQILKATALE